MTFSGNHYYIKCSKGLELQFTGMVSYNEYIHYSTTRLEMANKWQMYEYTAASGDDGSWTSLGVFTYDYMYLYIMVLCII